MAGIGFRLQGYFTTDSLYKNLKGSVYSIVISSGPWLITVLTVGTINFFAQRGHLASKDLFIFKSIISYTYAFSLILFGMAEMPITRYLADKLFISDYTSFKNVYSLFALIAVIVGSICGFIFYSYFSYGVLLKLFSIALLIAVLCVWLAMVFLSAAKNYHQIVISFFLGGVTSTIGAVLLGDLYNLEGYVIGFSIGQIVTAILLTRNLFSEFRGEEFLSYEVLGYFKKFKMHSLIGLLYYLGIWCDKFIFWFTETGEHVDGLFYTNRYYDTAMFLAYLTIVPSLAIFLVKVETDFYVKYTYYFRAIQSKNDLAFLNESVLEIIQSLRNTLLNLIKFQTFISVTLWYFAADIIALMRLPALMEPSFQYGIIGSYLLALLLIINIVLLYFEKANLVLGNYFLFAFANATLSLVTAYSDFRYHGLGYVIAALVTLIVSYFGLQKTLKNLNKFTFMRQAISNKRLMSEKI